MQTVELIFTNDPELLQLPNARPARGASAFQIDALHQRLADGAWIVAASIPNYASYGGRERLRAYGRKVVHKLPPCLEPYAKFYVGQERILKDRETGQPIKDSNGNLKRGHVWRDERGEFYSLQLEEGAVLAKVTGPRPTDNGYTFDLDFILDERCTFSRWSSPVTVEAEEFQAVDLIGQLKAKLHQTAKPPKKRATEVF